MKYIILPIMIVFGFAVYGMTSAKTDYIIRANVTEALDNVKQFFDCLAEGEGQDKTNDECSYTDSDKYTVNYSRPNHAIIDFDFEFKDHDMGTSRIVKGSIKLLLREHSSNSPRMKCENMTLKKKYLPSECR